MRLSTLLIVTAFLFAACSEPGKPPGETGSTYGFDADADTDADADADADKA